ncbi:MAG: hypothetical protein QF561_03385 [Phycisphaerales bacterium]|jgi:hypothetical protein|nr:hypothetical protein [Phycisphaerales bacterium]
MLRLSTTLVAATLLALALGGCSSNPERVSTSSIRGNLTPELRGTTETQWDIDNNMAIVGNVNLRQASDDLGRIFLMDQPSILSPYPIIPTGKDP